MRKKIKRAPKRAGKRQAKPKKPRKETKNPLGHCEKCGRPIYQMRTNHATGEEFLPPLCYYCYLGQATPLETLLKIRHSCTPCVTCTAHVELLKGRSWDCNVQFQQDQPHYCKRRHEGTGIDPVFGKAFPFFAENGLCENPGKTCSGYYPVDDSVLFPNRKRKFTNEIE